MHCISALIGLHKYVRRNQRKYIAAWEPQPTPVLCGSHNTPKMVCLLVTKILCIPNGQKKVENTNGMQSKQLTSYN